jgi:UDP-2-acetamido-3-amino-2,3-dideoxy-glucuronate N-acetyltransferase
VIGLGHWGRNLVRNMMSLGHLAALCDITAETLSQFSCLYPTLPVVDRPEVIFGDPGIDAVMIATPAVTHGALVRAALEAGKHVFVEKPMCLDVAEAEALVDLARERDRQLMVGHLLLYHPAFTALRAAISAGRLGRLRYIYSTRLSLGRIRRDENALWSFAPHDISMILALSSRMPTRVAASGSHILGSAVADSTLSHLTFPEELQAHVFVSWLHPYKDHRLVVVGERAMAVFNDVEKGPEKLLLYPHRVDMTQDIPTVSKASGEPIPYDQTEPLRRECEAFVDAVRGIAVPPSDGREGIRTLRVLNACQRALETGTPVSMDTQP